ncbi:MAG: CopD family protein [Actinobacteria bacterium]|nr:CopD family protein [Actinomycetota bacterium]
MVIAAYNDNGYKLMVFLHILAVIVAFAPSFVWPFVSVRLKQRGEAAGPVISQLAGGNTMKIYGPAAVLAGIFGFGIIGMSDKLWEFSAAWISAGMLVWFLILGVMFGMMAPAEKKLAEGDASAEKILSMAGGILHLLLAIELIIMVFKPGAPAGL